MKKTLTFILVSLSFMSYLFAQEKTNIYSLYTEPEIREFLSGKGYTVNNFNAGRPDSLNGAVLFTSFFSIAGTVESYPSSGTAFFKDAGIGFEGDLIKCSSMDIVYTIYATKGANTPCILLLGTSGWMYEFSFSNVNTSDMEYFRIYMPSFIDNKLTEFGWFLVDRLDLVIRKPEIEWVEIPGGTFIMGASKKEKKRYTMPYAMFGNTEQHEESVGPFEMSKYEVTYDQFDAFCKATGRKLLPDAGYGRGNRPVIFVSYFDALDFAEWMGCRLPTETEWEFACRAGTTTFFNTGECLCCDLANVYPSYPDDCCSGKYCTKSTTMPVGSYAPNAWGLYDMHGNVCEWTSTWHDNYITSSPLENGMKTIRGGSFKTDNIHSSSAARFGMYIRDDSRNYIPNTDNCTGFRVVRDM